MAVPSFLIVVPTYNSYRLLPVLVSSLTSQTYLNWRVLFVDGPSSSSHRSYLNNLASSDPRFQWVEQDPSMPGIFGAMNYGIQFARSSDWLLFWGSDDWAPASTVLAQAASVLSMDQSSGTLPDLLVCVGRYVNGLTGDLKRYSSFTKPCVLDSSLFRRILFWGSTPPHQATFFGPGAYNLLASYSSGFSLSADLNYFLELSRMPGLTVRCLDLELVHMSTGGVSSRFFLSRLIEVFTAYWNAFGWLCPFSFFSRYVRRFSNLLAFES
ncbi:glycosyltransferase [Synechococcus sp. M16.1]|uniref:glycosyltransferase n=1 Tax=Synechococcus sp. M16.1 TaxID=1442553 RepID=UPI0018617677|nr:glycosyltransferase [Synechococcus sp. M16.1]QNJ12208.1 glycosyltransferase/ family 2 [Synechococcus sp. M16.1]